MKNKSLSILLLSFGLLGVTASGSEPEKGQPEAAEKLGIEGTWQLTKMTMPIGEAPGFRSAPAGYAESLKISFKDGTMTMIPGEPGYTTYTYTIDPKKKLKQLTWKPAEASNENDKPVPSIYKIEGDKIVIAFQVDQRPLNFDRKKSYTYEGTRFVKAKAEKK